MSGTNSKLAVDSGAVRGRLAEMLTQRGKSMRKVSLEIGKSSSYVHSIIKDGKEPSLRNFFEICRVADLDPLTVLFGEGREEPVTWSLSTNLVRLRKDKGLTQVDLADRAGVAQPTISRLESGDDSATLSALKLIANGLGVQISDLFSEPISAEEEQILTTFRALSPERQKGWIDLCATVLAAEE